MITRASKGSPLTHEELDSNLIELQTSISEKANATDVFTKSESNANYAAKAGDVTQTFNVDDATLPTHAVSKSQLDATEKVHRYNNFVVSGTANDITLTLQADRVGVTAIEPGVEINFVATLDNTGPVIATVNFVTQTLSNIPVSKMGAVPLEAGDIIQGAAYKLFYDGAGFQLFSGAGGGSAATDLSNYYTKTEVDAEMAKNRIPVGFVMAFSSLTVPTGYIKCHGQYLLIADFPDLYAVVGHTFDDVFNPDPLLYFRIPELRGEFIRGSDEGRMVDKSPVRGKLTNGSPIVTLFDSLGNGFGFGLQISGTGIPDGTTIVGFDINAGTVTMSASATTTTSTAIDLTITGRIIGTAQTDTVNRVSSVSLTSGNGAGNGPDSIPGDGSLSTGVRGGTWGIGGSAGYVAGNYKFRTTGHDNRPRNVAMCYCIKAFDTVLVPAEVTLDAFVTTKIDDALALYDVEVDEKISGILPKLKAVASAAYWGGTKIKDVLGNVTLVSYDKNIYSNHATFIFQVDNVGKAFTTTNFTVSAHGYNMTYSLSQRDSDNRFSITGYYPDNGGDSSTMGIEFTLFVAV